jgi:hypothetical protein
MPTLTPDEKSALARIFLKSNQEPISTETKAVWMLNYLNDAYDKGKLSRNEYCNLHKRCLDWSLSERIAVLYEIKASIPLLKK